MQYAERVNMPLPKNPELTDSANNVTGLIVISSFFDELIKYAQELMAQETISEREHQAFNEACDFANSKFKNTTFNNIPQARIQALELEKIQQQIQKKMELQKTKITTPDNPPKERAYKKYKELVEKRRKEEGLDYQIKKAKTPLGVSEEKMNTMTFKESPPGTSQFLDIKSSETSGIPDFSKMGIDKTETWEINIIKFERGEQHINPHKERKITMLHKNENFYKTQQEQIEVEARCNKMLARLNRVRHLYRRYHIMNSSEVIRLTELTKQKPIDLDGMKRKLDEVKLIYRQIKKKADDFRMEKQKRRESPEMEKRSGFKKR